VFGARIPTGDLAGLPELVIGGLREDDARAVLDSALTGPLDARVRDQIIAEAHGNPLALLELPRGWTAAELAGGFGLPGAVSLSSSISGTIEESFRQRIDALPAGTRHLLLLAAADPTGDPVLVRQAAGRLRVGAEAAAPAVEAGLAEFDVRVRFRHPLVRSVAYQSASAQDRQAAHRTLAEAPIRSWILIAAPGTGPRPPRSRMRRCRGAGALGRPGAGAGRAGRGGRLPRSAR
jgi:hypothetical protein